jgi:hypothetical protein
MLPRPTAEPIAASVNPIRLEKVSRAPVPMARAGYTAPAAPLGGQRIHGLAAERG